MPTCKMPKPLQHWVSTDDIALDPGFASLLPALSEDERVLKRSQLALHGCREVLIVWKRDGRRFLVTGYEQFALLQELAVRFQVVEKDFLSHAEARLFF